MKNTQSTFNGRHLMNPGRLTANLAGLSQGQKRKNKGEHVHVILFVLLLALVDLAWILQQHLPEHLWVPWRPHRLASTWGRRGLMAQRARQHWPPRPPAQGPRCWQQGPELY